MVQFDGLRGVLGCAVVIHHYLIWRGYAASGVWRAPEGNLGNQLGLSAVALFFMMTGFLFYPRIQGGIEAVNWARMFVQRVFRLVPMLLLSTLLCAALLVLREGARLDRSFLFQVLAWLAGVQVPLMGRADAALVNAGVFWTIKWEWAFYFVLLPALAGLRSLWPRSAWTPVVPGLLLASLALRVSGLSLFVFLPLFLLGMLGCELAGRVRLAGRLRTNGAGWSLAVLLAGELGLFHDPYETAATVVLGLFFIGIACGNDLFGVLRWRALRVLGDLSFGVYVLHGIVLYLGFALGLGRLSAPVALPLLMAFVIAAAALAHWAIERPGIALGQCVASRLGGLRRRLLAASLVDRP
ncbi:acyltransferase family protein [Novosphingobium profundi]|uniref:acyltransferase family protein n=1 Tax=Novosphingobium profundi TaxID=1774954 RepID=UPI001BDA1BF7|nr:acyltransferase [Novosphingobium profundi]